ncbi:hypothetical protein QMK19_08465 [Streptomyces sp. H10-C2]|uniref:hypothetical protein n=1 Tax=unclassified Streptomyces TaxID=2593676 RepID=UPI0024B9F904|nr:MULTISPECIES: hypothetical protein [unclassified Streptomyces]MDJ0341057.1 hypothetical protein [Streptomyces sp. PH10-H1]MDJ0369711.1 hypothetical protein [Streptomyces sp. H10-C2]
MSEYQYYEFQAIDRPLTKDELEQVRALSSRARISATHFVNEYHYGNFRGDEHKLVEQLYDAHLYFANWGSRRLMLRLPTTLLPARSAEPYCVEDALTCWTRNGHLLLDFACSAEDSGEWDFETSFTLASFTTLRTELAAGDLRSLYLAWLSALTRWELEEDVDEDEYTYAVEAPVPAGLAHLTGPQQALADFLHIDPHLLTALPAPAVPPLPRQSTRTRSPPGSAPCRSVRRTPSCWTPPWAPPHSRAPRCWPATAPRPTVQPNRPPPPGTAQPRSSSTPPTRCAARSPRRCGRRAVSHSPTPASSDSCTTACRFRVRSLREPGVTSVGDVRQHAACWATVFSTAAARPCHRCQQSLTCTASGRASVTAWA